MRPIHIATVSLLVLTAADASNITQHKRPHLEPPTPNDFTGIFALSGNEGEDHYRGVAYIRKINGLFLVNVIWHDQLESISGVGQTVDGNLSIGWVTTTLKSKGVTVYRKDGKNLTGTMVALPGPGSINKESLFFLKGTK